MDLEETLDQKIILDQIKKENFENQNIVMQEKNIDQKKETKDVTLLTDEEIRIYEEKTNKEFQEELKISQKNKEDYWNLREALLKTYKDKFIAFSNGKVIGVANTAREIGKFIENDSSAFTTLVGNETYKESSIDKVLLLNDLKSRKDPSKTCCS